MEPKKQAEVQVISTRRNPYLVDYEEKRSRQELGKNKTRQSGVWEEKNKMPGQRRKSSHRRRLERQVKRRRLMVKYLAVICLVLLFCSFIKQRVNTNAAGTSAASQVENTQGTLSKESGEKIQGLPAEAYAKHPTWTEDFLTPNEYSRPGDSLEEVNSIFVHYTANPGTSAAQNRSYFEQLKDNHERGASAHFIIGYEGEIIQCIPLDEIAYAVQTRNFDSISIECCYLAEDGSFTQETYDSLVELLQWLVEVYDLEEDDILRHYDCGGKKCPIYYVEHEDAWEQLKRDVME